MWRMYQLLSEQGKALAQWIMRNGLCRSLMRAGFGQSNFSDCESYSSCAMVHDLLGESPPLALKEQLVSSLAIRDEVEILRVAESVFRKWSKGDCSKKIHVHSSLGECLVRRLAESDMPCLFIRAVGFGGKSLIIGVHGDWDIGYLSTHVQNELCLRKEFFFRRMHSTAKIPDGPLSSELIENQNILTTWLIEEERQTSIEERMLKRAREAYYEAKGNSCRNSLEVINGWMIVKHRGVEHLRISIPNTLHSELSIRSKSFSFFGSSPAKHLIHVKSAIYDFSAIFSLEEFFLFLKYSGRAKSNQYIQKWARFSAILLPSQSLSMLRLSHFGISRFLQNSVCPICSRLKGDFTACLVNLPTEEDRAFEKGISSANAELAQKAERLSTLIGELDNSGRANFRKAWQAVNPDEEREVLVEAWGNYFGISSVTAVCIAAILEGLDTWGLGLNKQPGPSPEIPQYKFMSDGSVVVDKILQFPAFSIESLQSLTVPQNRSFPPILRFGLAALLAACWQSLGREGDLGKFVLYEILISWLGALVFWVIGEMLCKDWVGVFVFCMIWSLTKKGGFLPAMLCSSGGCLGAWVMGKGGVWIFAFFGGFLGGVLNDFFDENKRKKIRQEMKQIVGWAIGVDLEISSLVGPEEILKKFPVFQEALLVLKR